MRFGSLYRDPSRVSVCASCQSSSVPQQRTWAISSVTLWLMIFSETLEGCWGALRMGSGKGAEGSSPTNEV